MEKRGQFWFTAQFILFCAILVVPFVGKFDEPLWLRAVGLLILIGGVIVAVSGYRSLGSNHSPWTNPIEGGQLVTAGSYRYCRHPIYSGLLLVTLGWALAWHSWFGLAVTVAGVVFY